MAGDSSKSWPNTSDNSETPDVSLSSVHEFTVVVVAARSTAISWDLNRLPRSAGEAPEGQWIGELNLDAVS